MLIRPATRADAHAIMEIRLSVRENVITPARLEELGINEQSIAAMIGTTHLSHCAEEDGVVAGFVMAEKSTASIWALFVHPDFEGRGLGRRLLERSLAELWEAGHRRSTLSTEPDTRAYRFYTSLGWRHVGTNRIGEAELELLRPDL